MHPLIDQPRGEGDEEGVPLGVAPCGCHGSGWQSSLQRTSLQEDTPPGGHASRRTRLQADTPPGRTLLQEDIPPVVKFFRCLQSDNPPAEGLQEDSSPAQRLQADRPPGGHSSSQKNIQVKAASYTVEIQFDHHNLNSSSHPVPILPLNSGFSSCWRGKISFKNIKYSIFNVFWDRKHPIV